MIYSDGWYVEQFFPEINSQDIKYDMRRMQEIIFMEKVKTKHQVMYHCQKHRMQLMHMKVMKTSMCSLCVEDHF